MVVEVSTFRTMERTLAVIKPDAVKAGKELEIMQLIEKEGFTIIAQERYQLTKDKASQFYGEHDGKPFFEDLTKFMSSGPCVALVLQRANAITSWRLMMGPTNSHAAREEAPLSLRALYGTDGRQNATHGSDSQDSSNREIKFFFPRLASKQYRSTADATNYIKETVEPTLMKGLVNLCKVKPSSNPTDALEYLGQWLLDNNPNKAKEYSEELLPLDDEDEDNDADYEKKEEAEVLPALDSFNDEDVQNIIKIQAAQRGRLVRKSQSEENKEEQKEEEVTLAAPEEESKEEPAAEEENKEELPALDSFNDEDVQNIIKIQAAQRGRLVRKQSVESKDTPAEVSNEASEEPATEASEEPAAEEPTAEEPATEEPATEEPATEEPATEEPATEEPATEEPAAEEPATEEPATEEPAAEEPATEEPATEEPATEEPTAE